MSCRRVVLRLSVVLALCLSALAGSTAAQPNVTVVMSGLDNPRGLAFGPDGALYVVEAGSGGEEPCRELRGAEQCYGATGRITRLWQGEQQQVVGELPSFVAASGEATGPHDISFVGSDAYVTIGFGANPALRAGFGPAGALFGTLLRVPADGPGGVVADIAQYEADVDPDQAGADSNPFGLLAEADRRLVVDAGGNDLVSVDEAGDVTTFAVLPENPVPTSIARGPDGAYYIGELTGFPFPQGAARVVRIVEGEEPEVFLEGFTTIVDLAFGPDGSLYVLQHATGFTPETGFAPGQLIRVGRDGTRGVVMEGLINPTSVALGPDGAIYVTNNAVSVGEGEVLQITLPYTRYFAEGAVGDFFDTTYALFNPNDAPVAATLRFASETGDVLSHTRTIPAGQQVTVAVDPLVPSSWVGVSAVIEADQPLVTSRTVTWGQGGYGSDTGTGVPAPLPEWWIAEGATGVYSLFYLLQNPGDQPAEIEITYFRPGGQAPVTRAYTVGAHTRRTILVNSADGTTPDPELGDTTVSAHIVSTNGVPVVAERAMYLTTIADQPFTAGTLAAAVPLASERWSFAEGATGFFNMFLLLANPTGEEVDATVRYLLPASAPIEKVYTLEPMSRQTVWVNGEDAQLTNTTVAIEVTTSTPILAERAMWWGASGIWDAGHVSTGVGQAALKWALTGLWSTPDEVAYVLLANPSTEAMEARLTLAFEDGREPLEATVPVAAGSRVTVQLAGLFPAAAGAPAAVTVESTGDTPMPLVVEGTAYGSPNGQPLGTGRAVPALPLAAIP